MSTRGKPPQELYQAARDGDRAATARLLSLIERGGEGARDVGRLAAPNAGEAYTVGLKYAHQTSRGNEWSTRLEFYRQESKAPAEQLIGNQPGNVQMPDFDAIILQFSYHFKL